jgi:hypothetical protein
VGDILGPLHAETEAEVRRLTVEEVIDNVYLRITGEYGIHKIKPNGPVVVGTHGSSVPEEFDELDLVGVNGSYWIIGQAGPADPVLNGFGDMTAMRLGRDAQNGKDLVQLAESAVKERSIFGTRKSLLRGSYGGKMNSDYRVMRGYMAGLDYDGLAFETFRDFTKGCPPDTVYGSPVEYSPRIVGVLLKGIERTLGA